MKWQLLLLLAGFSMVVLLIMAAFQPAPGYMDADAYFVGGRQLATGKGFTEPYLWNYLDDPAGIPHPSNTYWMPLISLLSAAGSVILGQNSWFAARVWILIVAACLPPLTATLAYSFTGRKKLSFFSGLLAVFPAFYLPFLTVTDTFGLYMLFGGIFFLVLSRSAEPISKRSFLICSFTLGIISGLMHLTRADGFLWLLLAILAILFVLPKPSPKRFLHPVFAITLAFLGYLVVIMPWFIRNIFTFGVPLAPGGVRSLWLTSYNQLFSYPASQLTIVSWWQSGLNAIVRARLWALGLNLANTLAVQGEVFLLPLIGLGLWHMRKDKRVPLAGLAWLLTLGVMTVIFPFAGARGGFFHSGAALQPIWWAMATLGLDKTIEWGGRKRRWDIDRAGNIFRIGLIGFAVLLTLAIFWSRGLGATGGQSWDQEDKAYRQIHGYLVSQGATAQDTVMVANPPGFYLASGNPAIAIPDGDIDTVLAVARKYHAIYLVLEEGAVPVGLLPAYSYPGGQSRLIYLGDIEHARIFLFHFY